MLSPGCQRPLRVPLPFCKSSRFLNLSRIDHLANGARLHPETGKGTSRGRWHPGLNIEVRACADNVGGDAMNQTLSENRAGSVRDYRVQPKTWRCYER